MVDYYKHDLERNKLGPEKDAGEKVLAVADGKIAYLNKEWGWVVIEHTSIMTIGADVKAAKWWSSYMHATDIPPSINPGNFVAAGAQIGGIGNIGKITGIKSHLDFAIHVGADPFGLGETWNFKQNAIAIEKWIRSYGVENKS